MANRVMFVAPSAYTFGGVQTWLDYLLPALSDNGRDVTLGLVSGRFHDAKEYLRIHPFDNSYLIHLTTGTRQGRVQSLQKAIAECRPDIVVVVNIVDAYIAAALLRSQSTLDVRIAATLHGLQPDFLQDFETYRDQLDAVICTNRLAGAVVEEWSGLATDRIFYAPCGIEIPDSESGENSAAHSLLRVAYVGRLDHFQKRISDVVDIVRACVESGLALTLTVAGGGPEEDAFMASVDRAGLNDHVNFLGVLDQQQLRAQVYANSDVLLLTSSWETGPIVAWEAMAEGAVVVTSDYLGRKCEGSLEDGANCLVYPVGDIEGAVECLKKAQDRGIRTGLPGLDMISYETSIRVTNLFDNGPTASTKSAPCHRSRGVPFRPASVRRAGSTGSSAAGARRWSGACWGANSLIQSRAVNGRTATETDRLTILNSGPWPAGWTYRAYPDIGFCH